MASDDLTLFDLEDGLRDLMAARDEVTDPVEVAQLDVAIRAYVEGEVRKVDGIRAYLRHCEVMATAAKDEAARQLARAGIWKGRGEKLKAMVLDIATQFGVRRFEGRTGVLSLRGNGGIKPLEITQPAMVPDEYRPAFVSLTSVELQLIVNVLSLTGEEGRIAEKLAHARHNYQPDTVQIRAALERGESVPGCRLLDRGEHVRVE